MSCSFLGSSVGALALVPQTFPFFSWSDFGGAGEEFGCGVGDDIGLVAVGFILPCADIFFLAF